MAGTHRISAYLALCLLLAPGALALRAPSPSVKQHRHFSQTLYTHTTHRAHNPSLYPFTKHTQSL